MFKVIQSIVRQAEAPISMLELSICRIFRNKSNTQLNVQDHFGYEIINLLHNMLIVSLPNQLVSINIVTH